MDTRSSLQLYLNFERYLTLWYLWLFFLLSIYNWRLLCALYIVIDFYILRALKLLFQGTCSLFQRLYEGNYETFPRELHPRIPHLAASTIFALKKRCTHIRSWIRHCIHFSQVRFHIYNVTWLSDGLNQTFFEKTVC